MERTDREDAFAAVRDLLRNPQTQFQKAPILKMDAFDPWRIMDTLQDEGVFFMEESSAGTYGSIDGEIRDHGADLMYTIRDTHPFQDEEQRARSAGRLHANQRFPVYKILVLAESTTQTQRLRKELGPAVKIIFYDKLSQDTPGISDGQVKDLVKDYGMVIVDECHHVSAVSFESVLKSIGYLRRRFYCFTYFRQMLNSERSPTRKNSEVSYLLLASFINERNIVL